MVDSTGWRNIDPKVKTLWRLGALINALVIGGICLPVDLFVIRTSWTDFPVPPYVLPAAAALAILVMGVAFADAKFRCYRFRIGEDDLALSHGIWWKNQRFVNRARIQHVDINTNFLSSRLGLTEVQVHVGSHVGGAITIHGLKPEEADEIRRILLEGSMIRYREAVEAPPVASAPAVEPPPAYAPPFGAPPPAPEHEAQTPPPPPYA